MKRRVPTPFVLSFSIMLFCLSACKKETGPDYPKSPGKSVPALRGCSYQVSTFAGTGIPGYIDGPANIAQFIYPTGICNKQLDLYVTEPSDQRIRRISPAPSVTTFAYTPGSISGFLQPTAICYDPVSNNFYATDHNRILKIDAAGTVSVLAGDWQNGYIDHAVPARARFNNPEGICVNNAGDIFVADKGNHCIRRVSPPGEVSTLAGTGTIPGYTNGPGVVAQFNFPFGICFDPAYNCLYVTDAGNNRLRKVEPGGNTSLYAGTGVAGNADGNLLSSTFTQLRGVAIDAAGKLFVVQGSGGNTLRRVDASVVTTIIPDNGIGYTNGNAGAAQFNNPKYIVVSNANNYFITDYNNFSVRKVSCE